jgi:hypothetical protein
VSFTNIRGAAIECDDYQIAVLMNRVECKKQRKCGVAVVKCQLIYAFFF